MKIQEIKVSYSHPKVQFGKVYSAKDAYDILICNWSKSLINLQEEFKVLLMDRNNRVLGIFNQSRGGITAVTVDPKITFSVALKSKASSIIIAHNHPSGELNPSSEDRALTKRYSAASKFLDITLLDHLIITEKGYYSFTDEGDL